MRNPNDSVSATDAKARWQESRHRLSATEKRTLHCEIVTPMYGGGVRAGEVDREMPIRPTTIRGQLRFWWRIAHGPFASPQEMFERESAIWGGIGSEGPSASQVKVRIDAKPVDDRAFVGSLSEHDPGVRYAFGPAAINGEADWLKPGYSFDLSLSYPKSIEAEVEASLRWWASFGGLGARTRRGFGAQKVSDVSPVTRKEVIETNGLLGFAGVGGADGATQWKKAIGKLYEFRQKGGVGRNNGHPRPGRSYWPEPDQIRRFTGRNAHGSHEPEHAAGNVFPRAAFGLPITFEFKGTAGEPPTSELLPAGGQDRMASPLILRPYWDGQKWRPAALLLPGWQSALEQPVKFKGSHFTPNHWPSDPTERDKAAGPIRPMLRGGNLRANDPLSAFMHYFEQG